MHRVCMIEDDLDFAGEVRDYLGRHGFSIEHHASLDGALEWIGSVQPDVVILDQFVAAGDSLAVIPALREIYRGGIVVLTSNVSPVDKIVALECGADDFIVKVGDLREFLARVRAVLRRSSGTQRRMDADTAARPAGEPQPKWDINRLHGKLKAPDGTDIRLTNAEFQILMYLEDHAGSLVSRDDIAYALHNRPCSPFDRTVDNLVSRVRRALETYKGTSPQIRAIRGRGYIFTGLNSADQPDDPVFEGADEGGEAGTSGGAA